MKARRPGSARAALSAWRQHRPKIVAMVGLGPSANSFWLESAQWDNKIPWEEVWVVNRGSSAFRHDLAFNMHNLRELVQAAPNEELRLLRADTPIVTVKAYPEYPMSVEYPIDEVLKVVRHDLLSSTPAYMVAYAMMIGVKEMWLYGMDFHYQNHAQAEKGGQGLAFLLGQCQERGINFQIPHTSSLLDCYNAKLVNGQPHRPLYGYDLDPTGPVPDPRLPKDAKIEQPPQVAGLLDAHAMPRELMPKGADIGDLVISPDGNQKDGVHENVRSAPGATLRGRRQRQRPAHGEAGEDLAVSPAVRGE